MMPGIIGMSTPARRAESTRARALILEEHLGDSEIRAGTPLDSRISISCKAGMRTRVLLRVRRHTDGHLTRRQVGRNLHVPRGESARPGSGRREAPKPTFLHVTARRQETAHAQTQNQADRTLQLVHRVARTNQVCQGVREVSCTRWSSSRQRLLTGASRHRNR